MTEVYKYLQGIYKVDEMKMDTVTRGHSLKLKKERVTARQRRRYFRHRLVNRWNSLTEDVVSAHTLNAFKAKPDKVWCAYTFEQSDNFSPMRTNYSKDQLLKELKIMYVCVYACTHACIHACMHICKNAPNLR